MSSSEGKHSREVPVQKDWKTGPNPTSWLCGDGGTHSGKFSWGGSTGSRARSSSGGGASLASGAERLPSTVATAPPPLPDVHMNHVSMTPNKTAEDCALFAQQTYKIIGYTPDVPSSSPGLTSPKNEPKRDSSSSASSDPQVVIRAGKVVVDVDGGRVERRRSVTADLVARMEKLEALEKAGSGEVLEERFRAEVFHEIQDIKRLLAGRQRAEKPQHAPPPGTAVDAELNMVNALKTHMQKCSGVHPHLRGATPPRQVLICEGTQTEDERRKMQERESAAAREARDRETHAREVRESEERALWEMNMMANVAEGYRDRTQREDAREAAETQTLQHAVLDTLHMRRSVDSLHNDNQELMAAVKTNTLGSQELISELRRLHAPKERPATHIHSHTMDAAHTHHTHQADRPTQECASPHPTEPQPDPHHDAQIESLRASLRDANSGAERSDAKYATLLATSRDKEDKAQQQTHDLQRTVAALSEELNTKNTACEESKATLAHETEEKKLMHTRLEQALEEAAAAEELKGRLGRAESHIDGLMKSKEAAEEQAARSSERCAQAEADATLRHDTAIAEHKQEVASLTQENHRLTQELAQLQGVHTTAEADRRRAAEQHSADMKDLRLLSSKFEESKEEWAGLKDVAVERDRLSVEMERVRQELHASNSIIAQQKQLLKDADIMRQRYQDLVNYSSAQEQRAHESEREFQQLRSGVAEVMHTQAGMEAMQQRIDNLVAENNELTSAHEQVGFLQAEAEEAASGQVELKSQLAHAAHSAEAASTEIRRLEAELHSSRTVETASRSELIALRQEVLSLQDRLETPSSPPQHQEIRRLQEELAQQQQLHQQRSHSPAHTECQRCTCLMEVLDQRAAELEVLQGQLRAQGRAHEAPLEPPPPVNVTHRQPYDRYLEGSSAGSASRSGSTQDEAAWRSSSAPQSVPQSDPAWSRWATQEAGVHSVHRDASPSTATVSTAVSTSTRQPKQRRSRSTQSRSQSADRDRAAHSIMSEETTYNGMKRKLSNHTLHRYVYVKA